MSSLRGRYEQYCAPRLSVSCVQLAGVNVVPAFGPCVHVQTTVGESFVSQCTPHVGQEASHV